MQATYYELLHVSFEDLEDKNWIDQVIEKNLSLPIRLIFEWMTIPEKFFIHVDYDLGRLHISTDEYYEFDKNYELDTFFQSNDTLMNVVSFDLKRYPWVIDRTWNVSLRGMFRILEYCERLEEWKTPIPQSNNKLKDFWTFVVKLYIIQKARRPSRSFI